MRAFSSARHPGTRWSPALAGFTLLALLFGGAAAFTAEFQATVVAITDGDSLRVQQQQTQVEIRLNGIDCPEHGQAFGNQAKQAASELALGKTVTVRPTGQDQYGRTLADIVLPDGKSLNQELVRLGCAWWFRKDSNDQTLGRLEAEARKGKRGLWADPKPIPPWKWRQEQRTGGQPLSSLQVVPNGVEIAALLPNPAGPDEGHEQVVIRNTTSSDVDLAGWSLRDRAGNAFRLAGKVPAGGRLTITMTEPTLPLNNDGDEVVLIDGSGVTRSRVAYDEGQAKAGAWIEFGKGRGSRNGVHPLGHPLPHALICRRLSCVARQIIDWQRCGAIMSVQRGRDSPPDRSAYSRTTAAVIGRSGQSQVRRLPTSPRLERNDARTRAARQVSRS